MATNAHTFNVELASQVGLNQAILLQHLYYWHQINHKKKNNIKDDKIWTYNTIDEFHEIFPYLTPRQISYTFLSLEKQEYIETGNYNKASFDRTKWYTLTEKSLKLFVNSNLQNVKSNIQNVNSNEQNVNSNEQNVNTIPDNNTDSNTVDNTYITEPDKSGSDDERLVKIKNLYFKKLIPKYPTNRIGNRQHGLKKWLNLEDKEMVLAIKNLERYLKLTGIYVKSLQNYLDQRCFTEEWLSAEYETKHKKPSSTTKGNNTKNYNTNY